MLLHRDYGSLVLFVFVAFVAMRYVTEACYRLECNDPVAKGWNVLLMVGTAALLFILYLPWMEAQVQNPIAGRYAQWWGMNTMDFLGLLVFGSAIAGGLDTMIRHRHDEPYVSAESMISS